MVLVLFLESKNLQISPLRLVNSMVIVGEPIIAKLIQALVVNNKAVAVAEQLDSWQDCFVIIIVIVVDMTAMEYFKQL